MSKLSDIDEVFRKSLELKKHMEDYKKEKDQKKTHEEKKEDINKQSSDEKLQEPVQEKPNTFIDQAKSNIDELITKHEKIENAVISRLAKAYRVLPDEVKDKILDKYEDSRNEILDKIQDKSNKLEDEYKGEIKSVDYCQRKVDLESAGFKKYSQALEKEEEEVNKKIKDEPYYKNNPDKYEKERTEWKEEHKENVRNCRQEKQEIKKNLVSNLENPSEMAESLAEEMGPDYTGGDD